MIIAVLAAGDYFGEAQQCASDGTLQVKTPPSPKKWIPKEVYKELPQHGCQVKGSLARRQDEESVNACEKTYVGMWRGNRNREEVTLCEL